MAKIKDLFTKSEVELLNQKFTKSLKKFDFDDFGELDVMDLTPNILHKISFEVFRMCRIDRVPNGFLSVNCLKAIFDRCVENNKAIL
jgi:hypothetical protein